jgi:hypothetical protein
MTAPAGRVIDSEEPGPAPAHHTAPLEIRSIFPQELPLLVSLGGLRLVERFGDWSGRPFAGDAPLQPCICESA